MGILRGALPVVFQRKLLQDFIRQAENPYNVCVFEMLGWSVNESSQRSSIERSSSSDMDLTQEDTSNDIVAIPFIMQVEIGVRTQLESFRNNLKLGGKESADLLNKVCFLSRNVFLIAVQAIQDAPISAVDLSVVYMSASMTTHAVDDIPKMKSDSYASLSFTNFPMRYINNSSYSGEMPIHPFVSVSSSRDDNTADQNLVPNSPHLNFLVMNSQPYKGIVGEAASRRRSAGGADRFIESLGMPESYDMRTPVCEAKIDVLNQKDKFHG